MNSAYDSLLAKLRADEKELEVRLEKMRRPFLELEADLEHIKGTVAFYERKATEAANAAAELAPLAESLATPDSIPLSRLKSLSHSDAVIAIAKHNGGVVRTQEAKQLMIKAGIMSKTKNSTNMAHNAIKRTGRFERVSPGQYRLKTKEEPKIEDIRRIARLPFEVGSVSTQ